jgi:hypothetical protein
MAKGQKRSGREPKKPKASVKKTATGTRTTSMAAASHKTTAPKTG